MDERVQFISDYHRQLFTITELCERFGVSRKTGYKWIGRYNAAGAVGLAPQSSRPQRSPQATSAPMVQAIVALRKRYPTWGGKKILAVLRDREPTWALPAISTANDILNRGGLVVGRRRRGPTTAGACGVPGDARDGTQSRLDRRFQRTISHHRCAGVLSADDL
jgi:transposase-like protein